MSQQNAGWKPIEVTIPVDEKFQPIEVGEPAEKAPTKKPATSATPKEN
jgi:hypothetical protein